MSVTKNTGSVRKLSDVLKEEFDGVLCADPIPPSTASEENERLKRIYAEIHAAPARSALCFSGGGIRSASFGLGVLQGLAKAKLLGCFDYVSTVSGGGYLGGWLSAWIRAEAGGSNESDLERLQPAAARDAVFDKLSRAADTRPASPEWPPIRFLRAFSNYLSPKLGLFSADTWALVATFLRNMLLNWLVLIPLLLAGLMVPRVFMAAVLSRVPHGWDSAWWWLAAIMLGISTAYAAMDMPTTGSGKRSESSFLLFRLTPLVIGSFLGVLAWAWRYNLQAPKPLPAPGFDELLFLFGVPAALGAIGGSLAHWSRTKKEGGLRQLLNFKKVMHLAATITCTVLGAVVVRWMAVEWFSEPTRGMRTLHFVCGAPSLLLAVFVLLNFLLAGLTSWLTDDEDREWWGRSSGWLLLALLALALQSTLVFWGPYWLQILQQKAESLQVVLGWFGITGGVSGVFSALRGFSTRTTAKSLDAASSTTTLHIGAIIFLVVVDVLLAFATDRLAGDVYTLTFFAQDGTFNTYALLPWFLTAGLIALGVVMGWFINVNKFSLHTMYRNRLIRCFLGASRPDRAPHPFTGFDPRDNIDMKDLVPVRPLHIVNIALNVVATKNLAWQERMARSFTVSRLHSGAAGLGYQPSDTYCNAISLGTAVTISGAAASPNMGYHSSPLIALLMTLFNVRLGWWLANPGDQGSAVWEKSGPVFAAGPLFSEAVGKTTDDYKYVNLSDGGHFENLGIYEMVQRRCRHIVAVDGGQDGDYAFEDLGNAIRKIRIDLGIHIDIALNYVTPKTAKENLLYCAVGKIHYGDVDDGAPCGDLIYVKPVITGREPADVGNYRAAHPEFPHESTGDQFFSESQLESYRMLGEYAFAAIRGGVDFGTVAEAQRLQKLFDRAVAYTRPPGGIVQAG